jgi:hypothetical protein
MPRVDHKAREIEARFKVEREARWRAFIATDPQWAAVSAEVDAADLAGYRALAEARIDAAGERARLTFRLREELGGLSPEAAQARRETAAGERATITRRVREMELAEARNAKQRRARLDAIYGEWLVRDVAEQNARRSAGQ